MMDTGEPDLQIVEEGIDLLEGLDLVARLTVTGDDGLLKALPAQHLDSERALRSDHSARCQGCVGPLTGSLKGEGGHRVESPPLGTSLVHLDRGNERHLVLRAPTDLASTALPAQVGVANSHNQPNDLRLTAGYVTAGRPFALLIEGIIASGTLKRGVMT